MALTDRESILLRIAASDLSAALTLDRQFQAKAEAARDRPELYKFGRVKGTRELVVRPTYVMIYRVLPGEIEILRILHTARQWPPPAHC